MLPFDSATQDLHACCFGVPDLVGAFSIALIKDSSAAYSSSEMPPCSADSGTTSGAGCAAHWRQSWHRNVCCPTISWTCNPRSCLRRR